MTATTTSAPLPTRAVEAPSTGPSFAAALCGFLCSTVATTMVMFLLSSV